MEQVYWLSNPLEEGTEVRNLVYRYGRFCYAGAVVTEPVSSLEHLPGVLQGIQAVQGQIPYIAEYQALEKDSPHAKSLRTLSAAIDTIHAEIVNLEPRVAELAEGGATWLEDDETALYFEFEARPEHTCNGSDVVFAKSYRGEVLLTIIWYGPSGRYYCSLTPAGGEEQALVDTLFPSIYGKRRGAHLGTYEVPTGVPRALMTAFNGDQEPPAILKELQAAMQAADGSDATDSKLADRAAAIGSAASSSILPAWKLFTAVSVWEASEPVPDPDDLRDTSGGAGEGEDGEDDEDSDDDDDDDSDFDEETAALQVKEASGAALTDTGGLLDESGLKEAGPTVDLTGGSGYTQVYIVLSPDLSPLKGAVLDDDAYSALCKKVAASSSSSSSSSAGTGLIPRAAMFRFGDWVYSGVVDFPVDALRLGDVPFVLPALQKQQGRLEFLSEAKAFPAGHPMTEVMRAFMSAVSLLRSEMESCQDEVAALAEQSVNAWIDADWAASFFELAFAPGSVPAVLQATEVIACKIYLHQGTGIILHVVWFGGSLYCVLADSVEDLPLLDVAFPDVTARNRVVQVRTYDDKQGKKLAGQHGIKVPAAAAASDNICPAPVSLRVWEGRRKGIPGVGYGAALALGDDKSNVADAIREKARLRAEQEAKKAAEEKAALLAAADKAAKSSTAAAAATDSKASDTKEAEVVSTKAMAEALPAAAVEASSSSSSSSAASDSKAADADAADFAPSGGSRSGTGTASVGTGSRANTDDGAGPLPGASASADDEGAWKSGVGRKATGPVAGSASGRGAGAIPNALLNSVARAPHFLAPLKGGAPAGAGAAAGAAAGTGGDEFSTRNRLLVPTSLLAPATSLTSAGAGSSEGGESKLDEAPWDATGKPKNRL